jgi:hypothetical protein
MDKAQFEHNYGTQQVKRDIVVWFNNNTDELMEL